MAFQSLGKVTVAAAATRERLTKNLTDPTARVGCAYVCVKALSTNTNPISIGSVAVVHSTGVGAYVQLTAGQEHKFGTGATPGGENAADFYMDVTTNGEGAIVHVCVN